MNKLKKIGRKRGKNDVSSGDNTLKQAGGGIEPGMRHFLLTGEELDECNKFLANNEARQSKAWLATEKELVKEWSATRPCTRPASWWKFSETPPRWTDERYKDYWCYGKISEPRKRIDDGPGTTQSEMSGSCPNFNCGVPVDWILVQGWSDEVQPGDVVDINNPPIFESQAAYLERNNLLTAKEKKWLAKNQQALEPEVVKITEEQVREQQNEVDDLNYYTSDEFK